MKSVICICLCVVVLGIGTGVAAQPNWNNAVVVSVVLDTAELPSMQEYQVPSTVSIQAGGSPTAGDWFSNRGGGVTFQSAVRVQTFSRCHLGVVYVHQTINPKGLYIVGYYHDHRESRLNYTQHEIYAVIGANSGPRDFRQLFFYAELGAVAVSYQEVTEDGDNLESRANFGGRVAAGVIRPISRKIGLVFEVNGRLTGHWSDSPYRTSLGQLFGASIGLVFMAGK